MIFNGDIGLVRVCLSTDFASTTGIIFMFLTFILSIRLGLRWYEYGYVPAITALATMFSFMSSSIFILFAMWFDMESNKHLK